jgi:PAS domain S-box-containing protein
MHAGSWMVRITGRSGWALALMAGGVGAGWGNPSWSFLAGGLVGIGLIIFATSSSNNVITNSGVGRPPADRDERLTGENQLRPEPPGSPAADRYESAELLEALLDNSPDLIYFKDRQSRFVRYSRAFREFLHLDDTSTLAGKTDFDFFASEHARTAFEDEQNIIRTGRAMIGKQEKETHHDGRITWALTTKMPWRDKQGRIIGTFGISKDVTALKEAEQKLAHERELFQALVEHLPDAIYFKDCASRFVKLSRSKVERARQTLLARHHASHPDGDTAPVAPHLLNADACAEYLVGKSDFDLVPEPLAREAFQQEQNIIRTGEPLIGRLERILDSAGTPTWLLTTKMPWRNAAGKTIGTFGVTRDITALKEAEATLEETNKRLAHSSRLAGMAEVATDILHNVGNVLNSVNVSCSMVMERLQESPAANLARIPQMLRDQAGKLEAFLTTDPKGKQIPDYLGTLAGSIEAQRTFALGELDQLRRHIDHIKQVVAMQQNYAKVAGVEDQVEVDNLIDDALRINAAALDRHRVELQRDLEPVPPLLVDKHRVLQILVNLVSNAKYALTAGARPDKIMTVRTRRVGADRVQIEVGDNGIGIAPENLARVFAHGFTTRPDGHGFGLHSGALAAKELGGSLTVQSAGPGHGATFTLELPLKRDRPPTPT